MKTPDDLICLSHLRWHSVFQRPRQLMSRCAATRRVFFVEEPLFHRGPNALEVTPTDEGVHLAIPHLQAGLGPAEVNAAMGQLLDELRAQHHVRHYALWYCTPTGLEFTRHLMPSLIAYDCMDEFAGFRSAGASSAVLEKELCARADLVFTAGKNLLRAKRHLHPNMYAFPNCVDVEHFRRARLPVLDPTDQAHVPHLRLGYFGVIDRRLDLELIRALAAARPQWHIIMVGPVVGVAANALPRAHNIHYLGPKAHSCLPDYIAGWDVGIMPFARTEATALISPTKTGELLAAGKDVVSTPIADVVDPYGMRGLVKLATDATGFVNVIEQLRQTSAPTHRSMVDAFLAHHSWEKTWAQMASLLEQAHPDHPGRALDRAA